jgi:hypothetical protein
MAEKRVHRKLRNGNNNQPGDRGANGTRLAPFQDKRVRALIKTVMIIKRLNDFVEGEADKEIERVISNENGKKIKVKIRVPVMSQTQVVAALGLLRKTLPDLTTTVLKGDEDNPVRIEAVTSQEYIKEQLLRIGKLKKQEDGTYVAA